MTKYLLMIALVAVIVGVSASYAAGQAGNIVPGDEKNSDNRSDAPKSENMGGSTNGPVSHMERHGGSTNKSFDGAELSHRGGSTNDAFERQMSAQAMGGSTN